MYKQVECEEIAESLIKTLRELIRFTPYEQTYLVQMVAAEAEKLSLMVQGLGNIDFTSLDNEVESDSIFYRRADSWYLHANDGIDEL